MRLAVQAPIHGANKSANPANQISLSKTQFFEYVKAHVVVKESGIPNAGLGVFTTVGFSKNRILGGYAGENLSRKQFYLRYPDGFGEYVLQIHSNLYIDGVEKSHFSNMINDARGSGQGPNVEFTKSGQIKSRRKICAGEELLVDYGNSYFN